MALYARVSTDEQAQSGTSIETQLQFLRAAARLHEWEIYEEYVDAGFSGATDDRPGFQQMMVDATSNCFDAVAVTKLDRFMRDARLMLNAIETLKRRDVMFIAASEGVDTSDTGVGRLVLTVLAAVAEWERAPIRERTQEGRWATARNGGLLGGFVAYGFNYAPKSDDSLAPLEINDVEADVVRRMFRWVIDERM